MVGDVEEIEVAQRSSALSATPGMGALPFPGGVAFRVWAPHADAVAVVGDFNDWADDRDRLARDGGGYWSGEVRGAHASQRYGYVIWNGAQRLERKDPYARDVDHSNGPSVIVDRVDSFDWGDDLFRMPPWNELIIYEVYLRDNALYWLDDFRADGLRWDMTVCIRTVFGDENDAGQALPEGFSMMQWINREIDARWPWKISIAEDLQDNSWLTREVNAGGAGFDAQWAANFVHPVRSALVASRDEERSVWALRDAILGGYDGDAFKRVIYTESHDEVANGRARLPHDITPQDPGGWFARKRSTLGAALVFTAPGIPMIFQGQEFLEDEWFRDTDPVDWSKKERFAGILRLYQDLVQMRRDCAGFSGLQGHHTNVFHCNDAEKVIAFHRWDRGGAGDDVIIVLNLANHAYDSYTIGFPRPGGWRVRFNSDWSGYSADFGSHAGYHTVARPGRYDGMDFHGHIGIGPYTALVLTQNG